MCVQLELESHRLLLDRETADLTHIEGLKKRLGKVDQLLTHLSAVVEGKDLILGQLQTRAAENTLKIEAPYQA